MSLGIDRFLMQNLQCMLWLQDPWAVSTDNNIIFDASMGQVISDLGFSRIWLTSECLDDHCISIHGVHLPEYDVVMDFDVHATDKRTT